MSICCYTINKYAGLLANLVYMLLGFGIIVAAGLGLEMANPDSPEHTYFIESIVLGALICMIVIFGCYGLVTDLLVVNIIFSAFILLILTLQYVQIDNFHPHAIYRRMFSQMGHEWQQLDNKQNLMQRIGANLQASTSAKLNEQYDGHAALYFAIATRREQLFTYFTIGLEFVILIQTIVQSVLIYRCRYQRSSRNCLLMPAAGDDVYTRSRLLYEEI